MANRSKTWFTGDYEAAKEIKDKNSKPDIGYAYEELHITKEMLDALQSGKVIDIYPQEEYTVRISLL